MRSVEYACEATQLTAAQRTPVRQLTAIATLATRSFRVMDTVHSIAMPLSAFSEWVIAPTAPCILDDEGVLLGASH